MARTRTFLAIGLAGAVVATVAGSPELRAAARVPVLKAEGDRAAQNLRVFDAVWELVDRRFYDRSKTGASWDAARAKYRPKAAAAQSTAGLYLTVLSPMLDELGVSHVSAAAPKAAASEGPDPSLNGKSISLGDARGWNPCEEAGFDCAAQRGRLVVTAVRPGSKAARNGVKPGAIITYMDAPTGTSVAPVKLEMIADGAALKVEYLKDAVEHAPMEARLVAPGVLLVRFDEFERQPVSWALKSIESGEPRAVLLDLRGNNGGSVKEAARFMAAFLPQGAELGRRTTSDGHIRERVAEKASYRFEGPVAVLVGPFSNSAAEVVPAVFKHHRRACIVGLKTPGNVLTSLTFTLPDGGKLQLPISDYRTPSGELLERVGVTPDIEVMETPEALARGVNLAEERAVEALASGRCGDAPAARVQAGLVAQ